MGDRVGIIGVGRMGLPILRVLVEAGFPVTAFDIARERRADVLTAGASWSGSARELAEKVDILVTVLPGAPELRESMIGSHQALSAMRPGSCWLDLTSNSPDVAAEVAVSAGERGVQAVGAPMGGGVAAAGTGGLTFYVGGEERSFQRVRPLLAALGDDAGIRYVGADIRGGYQLKLLVNLLWFGQAVAATEALLLGSAMGLGIPLMREAFAGGPGGSAFISQHLDSLLAGDYMESFGIDRVVDELEIVAGIANGKGVPFELSSTVLSLHRQALERYGPVDGELLAARLLEERAHRFLRAGG
jgi:3-hydroxyisobutyrate dehydrogenase-like beta-hydroxyacid dehydrogenase